MGYTLTVGELVRDTVMKKTAYSARLTVSSDDEVAYPPKVFVMQEPDVGQGSDGPWFNCIASLVQMEDLPEDEVGEPVDGVAQPYFRVAALTITSRSASNLANFISRAEADIARLEQDLDTLQTLEA